MDVGAPRLRRELNMSVDKVREIEQDGTANKWPPLA